MSAQSKATILATIGDLVEDAAEESFILFSQELPHNDLGIINDKVGELEVEVNGREYTLLQSSGLLQSNRAEGTTGAVVWKVTPRVADWLASKKSVLWETGLLTSSKQIVELGCGVAGIIGMVIAPLVASYVLTDQRYVLKLLKENIARNTRSSAKSTRSTKEMIAGHHNASGNLFVVPLDWEQDSVQIIRETLSPSSAIDFVFVCDCVYNTYLIEPLTQTCVDICKNNIDTTTILMIAQQLRTDAVFEEWIARFLKYFEVWRLKDDVLPASLQSTSGYVIHLCALRSNG